MKKISKEAWSKLLFVLFGIICWSFTATGQSKIIGRIKDQQSYLPFVNVVLRQDSIISNGTTTDSLGNFALFNVNPGRYQLFASMIGYETHVSTMIEVGGETIVVPEIVLAEGSQRLDEIMVTTEKQFTDQQTDKTVINLEGSITGAGNTLLEVLQKSPGVSVNKQNGTIAINGKSGVRIMINDKILQVPPDVAIDMLDGMNSANVEKIEFLLTPSAAYDADGAGGIIHIVTKDNDALGTNGSITLTAGAKWAETLGVAMRINHRTKNAGYFFDYSFLRNHNLHIGKMERHAYVDNGPETVLDSSYRENITDQQNLNAGAEFNLSRNTVLNILVTGYKRDWGLDAESFTQRVTDETSNMSMHVTESNVWQSATGSIGLQRRLNAKSNLSLGVDYLYYHNNNPSDYHTATAEFSDITLSKKTPIHIFVGKADYKTTVSSTLSYEIGVKAVTSKLNNNVMVKRLDGSEWVEDSNFTSNSSLDEQIMAGYFSTQWTPAADWQINAGLRYEHTRTSISAESGQELIHRNYGYFFPALALRRTLSPRSEVYVAYTRRLTRPTYNDLAPFVFFFGPGTFFAGNTTLYPALSDGVTASYRMNPWTISLQYTHTSNEIAGMQPEMDNGNLIYRSQNLKYLNTFALSSSYSASITTWWEAQASVVAQYQLASTTHDAGNSYALYGVNINVMNTLRLPKDFSIEISGIYQSRTISGISQYLPVGSLNAGIQKKFGTSGTLKLAMDDILYTNMWRIETVSPENNLDVYFRYDWHNQFVRLTYTWALGNNKLRSLKMNSSSEEERQRVN